MASENLKNDLKFQHLECLSTQLENFRLNHEFSDITLVDSTGTKHFAHKNILAASSTYFWDKFNENPTQNEITLPPGISTQIVETLLKFSHSGFIDIPTGNLDFVEELNAASEILQFKLITDHCGKLFLESGDILLLWQHAETNNKEAMKKNICSKIAKEFSSLENSPDFVDIPLECLQVVVGMEELKSLDEDFVFKAILKWVKKDLDGRAKLVKNLAGNVDWNELSDEFLDSLQEDEDDLMESCPFLMRNAFKEVTKRLKNPKPKKIEPETESNPAVSNSTIGRSVEIEVYQPKSTQTSQNSDFFKSTLDVINRRNQHNYEQPTIPCAPVTPPKTEILTADTNFLKDLSGNLVTIKIGETSGKTSIEVRNLKQDQITIAGVTDRPIPLSAASCQDNNKIYIIGGRDECWAVLSSLLSYDVKNEKWENLPEMSFERWASGATVMNGSIYVVGGIASVNKRLNKVESYNLITREWRKIEDMKMCRERPAVCSYQSKVYVIGGYTVSPEQWLKAVAPEPHASCEIFDAVTAQWSFIDTKMSVGRNINEKIFMVGVIGGKVCALRAFCEGKFVFYSFSGDNWIDLPVTNYGKMEEWRSVFVLQNRSLCLVDGVGGIYVYKANGLWRIEGEGGKVSGCYCGMFE